MPGGEISTILAIQETLFKNVDPNIIVTYSYDGSKIIASNISEATFQNLVLTTNSPAFRNGYFFLEKIDVFLGTSLFPTEIFGLLDIVYKRVALSDSNAYTLGEPTNTPFKNGFKGGKSIGEVIDTLSTLSRATPDTLGVVKHFVLTFDPQPTKKTFEIKAK